MLLKKNLLKDKVLSLLSELWSLTRFEAHDLSDYAESVMFTDTRKGIAMLGLVSMILLIATAIMYTALDYDRLYIYSCVILAVLALHVAISSRSIHETRTLYLLGMTLLVVNGVAFVLLAHHSGTFNTFLFGSVIMLFLLMPLVPWGFREAISIVVLVYAVFTLSTLSVDGRFDRESLWMLQFAMFAAGGTTLIVIGRSILIRRDDLRSRFDLIKAHDHMSILSLQDPLTGAWNRRFMEEKFTDIKTAYQKSGHGLKLAIIDIDDFKVINDTYGHITGDMVLRRLVVIFQSYFREPSYFIRMGGDEFLLLIPENISDNLITRAGTDFYSDKSYNINQKSLEFSISVGLLKIPAESNISLHDAYTKADKLLYQAKQAKADLPQPLHIVTADLGQ